MHHSEPKGAHFYLKLCNVGFVRLINYAYLTLFSAPCLLKTLHDRHVLCHPKLRRWPWPFITQQWWRHQMETFSALLAICAGNSPVPGEFPTQRPVTQSFDVFVDLRLNKRLSKQSWGWWFETQSRPLWRYRNGLSKERRRYTGNVFFPNWLRPCSSIHQ